MSITFTVNTDGLFGKSKEGIIDKLKNGNRGTKIQIGNEEYTQKEWDKLLENFDSAEEKLQNNVKEEVSKNDNDAQDAYEFYSHISSIHFLPENSLGKGRWAPYQSMADENGIIMYKDVIYNLDFEHHTISLGDTTQKANCIYVKLSGGGMLIANLDNIDELRRSLDMFTPEDQDLILKALASRNYRDRFIQQLEDKRDETINNLKHEEGDEVEVDEGLKEAVSGQSEPFLEVDINNE